MPFRFTHPQWLWLLLAALPWTVWWWRRSDVTLGRGRRWTTLVLRVLVVLALVFALAGWQWLKRMEGMNVFFVLDRSDSVPSEQQEWAREYVQRTAALRQRPDKAGVIVFGADAAIESSAQEQLGLEKIHAVVSPERTDLAAAIRLGTAAFPETGQKRLVLLTDGNENLGDAFRAVLAAKALGVSVDAVPLGVSRRGDVHVQQLSLPNDLKKGQPFEVKILAQADVDQAATVRLFRNEQFLGEQQVQLSAGKNLFTFPQVLTEPGFYSYDVQLDTRTDPLPQNNRASNFTHVRGDPRVLVVSEDPSQDASLVEALRASRLEVVAVDRSGFPGTLAEMQSYDSIFLSNIAAGDLGRDAMALLQSAVRDFGVGLVCVGGDQAYAAGGYRGTPLEETLPLEMELSSKKVLPSGAVVLLMHGMEFNNGNQIARDCALGVLQALGPQDELGIVLWDGIERWLFELQKVGDKRALGRQIAGMNQGDLPSFQNLLSMAHQALKASKANLKHIIVFSDGDPGPPSAELMQAIVGDRITVSSVLIAGHAGPQTMIWMAEQGRGRFYDVRVPADLPQIFIKEAAVILKSAIVEEPFRPQVAAASEVLRGIGAQDFPPLQGYVATTPKPRAETPLLTDKGDPLLAHWQFGLGRAVAFTSDAKSRWARDWLSWEKYRQFWSQIAQWTLRRVENEEFTTDVSIDKGEGVLTVEAVDREGNYRNFLHLQAVVVSPKGERQTVLLEQTGPGHYEARFPTKEVGAYLLNLLNLRDGQVAGAQVLGASLNYSPEFSDAQPNLNLLRRLTEAAGGKLLDPRLAADHPFAHDRHKTFQPHDLVEWLLKLAVVLFTLDVGVRRVQIDRTEWLRFLTRVQRKVFFGRGLPRPPEAEESLAALLARRQTVRASQTAPGTPVVPGRSELFKPAHAPPDSPSAGAPTPPEAPASPSAPAPATPPEPPPASTASRLLEAKRRAQQRRK
jgi:uncharacterized membrane protein